MKKQLKIILSFLMMTAFLFSCKESPEQKSEAIATPEAQELKEFMLAGPYFMQDVGAVEGIEKLIPNSGNTKKMIDGYRDVFIFPFTKEQQADTKNIFKTMWDVNSKADLDEVMDYLLHTKDERNPHKAWDYSRVVNNACLGYSAGYLTKIEAKKYISEAFVLAKKDYKTWDDYFKDFNIGRNIWQPNSDEKAMYDKIIVDLTKNSEGIYGLLPLN